MNIQMKTPISVFCVALLATAISNSAQARPCAGNLNGYTLICRGNLQIQNHGGNPSGKDISFVRSSNAAGATGSSLNRGTCAWEDRPVSVNEPALIKGSVSPNDPGSEGWFAVVLSAAFDTRATVEVCVANDNAGSLKAVSNHAIVRFPRFDAR